MIEPRRFPPPWSLDDNGNCFIVKDSRGQPLAYVYYEHEGGRRTAARLIASNIAKLPELLKRASGLGDLQSNGPVRFRQRQTAKGEQAP